MSGPAQTVHTCKKARCPRKFDYGRKKRLWKHTSAQSRLRFIKTARGSLRVTFLRENQTAVVADDAPLPFSRVLISQPAGRERRSSNQSFQLLGRRMRQPVALLCQRIATLGLQPGQNIRQMPDRRTAQDPPQGASVVATDFDAPALPFGVTESFLDLFLRIKGTGRL
ncbi:hypothetical protein LU699_00160 [Luteimonas fraxinea]|uniref:hypothetical protein n=1 Tax=Luteimonas fraxinea TaxID=2901869 RepID=UPI001E31B70A|nr:hypothetical protein [Luteimonas fraxinea]UHH10195.1 hypothetical protein LU699_00160 [Luteimonas fraxinea]